MNSYAFFSIVVIFSVKKGALLYAPLDRNVFNQFEHIQLSKIKRIRKRESDESIN